MIEILWHGRGGQGAFTAAKLLGAAYVLEDEEHHFALSFPSFGPERRGAPMRAFTKLSATPIGDRSEIRLADYSIFLDDTLFSERAFSELKPGGKILLNTRRSFEDPRIRTVDGDGLAERVLRMPITNTIMLGAFAAAFGEVSPEFAEETVRQYMPPKLHEKNTAAIRAAVEAVKGATT